MEPKLIYKDRRLIVIDKPAGMPAVDVKGGKKVTLSAWIIKKFPKQAGLKDAGLVHRLDNETSGVIVAARTEQDYEGLRKTWNSKKVFKEYISLAIGKTPPAGKITALIAHHPEKQKRMVAVANIEEAKKLKARYAETEFELLETFPDYSLLKVKISTGARHQIRVHFSSIGHPIAGDKIYRRTRHESKDWLDLPRHFLHASKLKFTLPSTGKEFQFTSPLPDDLKNALNMLK